MVRAPFFARTALGMALALGVAAGGLSSVAVAKDKKPEAPKIQPTKAFVPFYQAAAQGLDKASKRQDVIDARAAVTAAEGAYRSAQGKKARDEAKAAYDGAIAKLIALLAPEYDLVEKALTAATAPEDKFYAGQLGLNLGNMAYDKRMQRRGILTVVESGKLPAADAAKYQYFAGALSYDLKEYPAARTSLQAAIAGGYAGDEVTALLVDAYINDNMAVEGLKVLEAASTGRSTPAPEAWLQKGVVVGYKGKFAEQANRFAYMLVDGYPTQSNWALSIATVRDMSKFANQELIDLMRLMDRTNSFSEGRDYFDYIQSADARRLPGETLKIIDKGIAAGKLEANDPAVKDQREIAAGRIAPDKASLAGLERDARAPNATAATAMAAGDAFLSYDNPAKAVEMYTIALAKPGVDSPRVLTRLGIAQTDLGLYADAQATFAKVTGIRQPIAQLWMAYAKSKAAGK
ncbi:MAG TPA: hypothetical protein VFV30_05810 [Novosphingobium sp.]|nr:hypothetical protein [Novosphingobium sp.]